jgi:Zn-dependent peptidase ImmA (M78 family)
VTKLESIYEEAFNDGIAVNDFHFSETKKAACMMYRDYKTIALDREMLDNPSEELSIIAEEYGHYVTGALYMLSATYNTRIEQINRLNCEGKAKRWAAQKLIPWDVLKDALNQFVYADGLSIYELAEYFDVTAEYMREALELYMKMGKCW